MLGFVPDEIENYAAAHTSPLSEIHATVWRETHERTRSPMMMVGPLEGALLRLLVRLVQARRVLEIGMFTGYGALAMAEALPQDGELVTCDVNPDTTEMARRYFAASPHGHKIQVKLGPALDTLRSLSGPFDLCFIDADKQNYGAYYDACIDLVRKNGLIVLDNMLQSGRVLYPQDQRGRAIAALNDRIQRDSRVENVLLPIRDGIMLAYKL
ncbi:MAG TPA: class I SAM-dependent methyltransferase [Candidatus Acidoferrales bacterium]|nr:class I SAM-dependent methyltransferase [Candidatus Acidoferrales bacterium]